MKLVGRVPVEPLSDERMTNIERAIVSGAADAAAKARPRESRWPMFGFAAVTVVVVLGAGLVGWKLRGGGEPATVAESTPLAVKTDANATTIDIGDAKISSDPSTAFVVTRAGTGVTIAMTRGKIGLDVVKRGGKDPLIVRAGNTDVEVVGTQFTVDFGDGTGDVDVRVTEGKVKVVRHKKDTLVAAGEAWRTDLGFVAKADAGKLIAKADKTDKTDKADKADNADKADKTDKADDIVIPVDMSKDVGLHDRTAQVPDARIPTTGSAGSGSAKITQGGPENVRPRTVDARPDPNIDLRAAILRQPVTEPIYPTLEASTAVSKYLEMTARTTGNEASRAFYSIAVVQHTKLGRNSDALRTLDAYFRRFRNGKEATDYVAARWLQVRINCLTADGKSPKIDDRCRQAAFTYAHEAPASPARTVAEVLSTARGD